MQRFLAVMAALGCVVMAGTGPAASAEPTWGDVVDRREEVVGLVLAQDVRFRDLHDRESQRTQAASPSSFMPIVGSSYYRVLPTVTTEWSELEGSVFPPGWQELERARHPSSWLVEVVLVDGCREPVQGGPIEDPAASPEPLAVTLPAPDAPRLAASAVKLCPSSIAYVTGADTSRPRVHVWTAWSATEVSDRVMASGTQPDLGRDLLLYVEPTTRPPVWGTVRRLFDFGEGYSDEIIVRRAYAPRLSPSGDAVAFSRSTTDLGDAWVRSFSSGQTTRLPGAAPRWSPTGEWVLVTEMYVGDAMATDSIVRPDGTDLRRLGSSGWDATWSPDGSAVAWTACDVDTCTVHATDIESGAQQILFTLDAPIRAMRWLPRGAMAIVTDRQVSGSGGDLYIVDLVDGSARSLTSGISVGEDTPVGDGLAVSPDGEWIAFTGTVDGRSDIYIASRYGGWHRLTKRGDASQPSWGSPF